MNSIQAIEQEFDMAAFVQDFTDEIATPYITIETKVYAKLLAAVEFLGGTASDVVGDAPYYPTFAPEPDYDDPPVNHVVAKALQLVAWGDNGLNALDKMTYELVLRMTKTEPDQDGSYVAVNLSALSKRLGASNNTVSKSLWGLVDTGLLSALRKRDPVTGNTHIYARAGRMPVWGERYAQNTARQKDAKRKRECQGCGGTKFATKLVCINCGQVHQEDPRSEELIDVLADLENTPPTTDSVVGPPLTTSDQDLQNEVRSTIDLTANNEVGGTPTTDSRVGGTIYHIGPRCCSANRPHWACFGCGRIQWTSHERDEWYCQNCGCSAGTPPKR